MLAYHVTDASNTTSILDKGITPFIGDRSEFCGEKEPAVYAFPTLKDCDTALSQWLGDWYNDQAEENGCDIELVVIEFEASSLHKRPFEVEFEVSFSERVRPELIRRIISEADIHHYLAPG